MLVLIRFFSLVQSFLLVDYWFGNDQVDALCYGYRGCSSSSSNHNKRITTNHHLSYNNKNNNNNNKYIAPYTTGMEWTPASATIVIDNDNEDTQNDEDENYDPVYARRALLEAQVREKELQRKKAHDTDEYYHWDDH